MQGTHEELHMAKLLTLRVIVMAAVLGTVLGMLAIPAAVDASERGGNGHKQVHGDEHKHDHDRHRIDQLERENARLRRALIDAARKERIARRQQLAIRLDAAITELSGVRVARGPLDGELGTAKVRYADADARYRAVLAAAKPIERELRARLAELKLQLQIVARVEQQLAADPVIAAPVIAARQSLETARTHLARATEDATKRIGAEPGHADLKAERNEVVAKLKAVTGDLGKAQRLTLARTIMVLDKRINTSAESIADLSEERSAVDKAERALAQAEAAAMATIHAAPQRFAAVAHANLARVSVGAFQREHAKAMAAVDAANTRRSIAKNSVHAITRRIDELDRRTRVP
jgi:hypothetical protein